MKILNQKISSDQYKVTVRTDTDNTVYTALFTGLGASDRASDYVVWLDATNPVDSKNISINDL